MSLSTLSSESPNANKYDPTAVEILFRRYWSSTGWTQGTISPAEFDYAKRAKVMFDPADVTHDGILSRAVEIRKKVSVETIGNAFLASLSSRRMEWRSALGSLGTIFHLPSHSFVSAGDSKTCAVCGTYAKSPKADISVLNFERLKWGGVRHEQPHYASLDIEWFSAMPHPKPKDQDLAILKAVINKISQLADNARPGSIEKALVGLFPSNAWERRTVVDILGFAGILIPRGRPTFWQEYPIYVEREQPAGKNDWHYPVLWWTGSDGINPEALKYWFPNVKSLHHQIFGRN
jgi:hypothetical protein